MSGLGKHSCCVKLYRWSIFLPPVTSSGAALLLQPFVQDHFANQQHTTRCKCTGKSKLPPFSALRPCKLKPSPPALPWKTVFQPSVRLTLRRICKPCCKIGCCQDRLSTEGISLCLSTLSPCATEASVRWRQRAICVRYDPSCGIAGVLRAGVLVL